MIDSLVDTNVYFELPIALNITCNATKNQDGKMAKDDSDNSLVSMIDSGDTFLGKLESYNGSDGLLLYNETTNEMEILAQGDLCKVHIDFRKGLNYYIGAKKIIATRQSGFVFDADIGTKQVFKIFLDGREVLFYTKTSTTITVQQVSSAIIDDFTKLVVILYDTNAITDSTEFVISYNNYKTIYHQDTFMNLAYFKDIDFRGQNMESIQSVNPNQEVTKTNIRNGFKDSDLSLINKVKNTLDVVSYIIEGQSDLTEVVGSNDFRVILINPFAHRLLIFNNCRLDRGISFKYDKGGNTRSYALDCGNTIEINVHEENGSYGEGLYGKGLYGTNTYIVNSSYIGGKFHD